MHLQAKYIMPPIKLGYCSGNGMVNDKHLNFYKERNADIGAITVEPLYMDSGLRELPTQLGIDNDDKIPGLKKIVQSIQAGGAQAIAHLNHPGRMANPKIPGNYFLSATDSPCENGGAKPISMDTDQMDASIRLFVQSAIRAEKSGFDMIELQMGHGYLLAQFLAPDVNDRKDEFGGSLESRMRYPLAVFDAIHSTVNIPIIVRVSGSEMTPSGIQVEETLILANELEVRGAVALHVSAGSVCSTPPWFFQHMFIPKGKSWEMAAAVQSHVSIPVIFVGQVNSPEDISELEDKHNAQYIAIGRALIADPHFISKLTGAQSDQIRPCLACSEGCLGGVKSGLGLHCLVNPTVGEPPILSSKPDQDKRFAVIGAGLAGMEAAIGLYDRGYGVELYEKDQLGGQFNLASLPPGKASLARLVKYYRKEISLRKIKRHNLAASAEHLLKQSYDEIIIATGSAPQIPSIEGLKEYYWTEFLDDRQLPHAEKILIIGGGLIGLEIASKLVEKQNEVIIVDLLPDVAIDMELIERTLTLKKLKANKVKFLLETRVSRIEGNTIHLAGANAQTLENIDKIVLTTGMRSENSLYDQLNSHLPCHLLGDARRVSKAGDAIRDAYETVQGL